MIDLGRVRTIVQDAETIVEQLDRLPLDDSTVVNKKAEAELNRQLLNLADNLGLASALVRNAYWYGKGEVCYDL